MLKIVLWMAVLLILGIAYKFISNKISNVKESKINYREAYKARQLLTDRESQEYKKLKQYADARGWLICPKVRLRDLIEPKIDNQILVNKIAQKHVDFVLVDQSMNLIGVLELDDSTHDRADRKQRDRFVREALEGAGITMIQTRSITPETLNGFVKIRIERKEPAYEEWTAAKLAEQKEAEK